MTRYPVILQGICRSPPGVFIVTTPPCSGYSYIHRHANASSRINCLCLLCFSASKPFLNMHSRRDASNPAPSWRGAGGQGLTYMSMPTNFSGNTTGFQGRGRRWRQLSGGGGPKVGREGMQRRVKPKKRLLRRGKTVSKG